MEYLLADISQPLSFVSCGHFVSDGEWLHDKRSLDSFEIIIGTKGKFYMQQDEKRYEVTPGKVLVLCPGRTHLGYKKSQGEVSFYWLHFNCKNFKGESEIISREYAAQLARPLKVNPGYNGLATSALVPIFSSPRNHERLIILFRQLLHSDSFHYYTQNVNEYFLTLILAELSQQTIDSLNEQSNEQVDSRLDRMIEWIRIHIDSPISVTELADRFGYNSIYLERRFKKHTGTTVLKFINELKLMRAKQLLCDSTNETMSIKEIAYSVGFKDEKYFMKLFRKYEGMTPTSYRSSFYKTRLNKS